jgi:hypothetical protein
MEPEGSLPISQELSTCTYPEPNQSNPIKSILNHVAYFPKHNEKTT